MDEVQGAEVLAELRELRQRVAELEAQAAIEPPAAEERSTRRGMLRLAGAAVVGGAAASVVGAQPAAATAGDNFVIGSILNNAGLAETRLISFATAPTLSAFNTGPDEGMHGTSTGSGNGVVGEITSPNDDGYAVFGLVSGTVGQALVGSGGSAQLFLAPLGFVETVAPTSGFHHSGEIVCNAGGFFACVSTGIPGMWRSLAGEFSAGAFYAITPTRVYDSRAAAPAPGLLAGGANRTISVADGRNAAGTVVSPDLVPAGATAVAANITVTGTTGGFGYLSVNPGGVTTADSSTINWFGPGQNIANGVSLTLNASRQLTVVCGAGGGSTHFIVDVSGYYI